MNANPFGWVEIPAMDLARAQTFYQQVFAYQFDTLEMGETMMAMFPFDHEKPNASGALVKGEGYVPQKQGFLVYFSVEDVAPTLKNITKAGGKVLQEKMSIGEHGFIGLFEDSEGNRLGLHSRQ
ncbi:VOC family protein [Bowmanella dokdonensis]|uniref:VOC family protein n=1 Tax=Bowmanella dokdonensis TaxID=751969 RepID=A0A939DR40_9ALTE|nr:VOC family protein [Bowmanella dokdonensis]MBN7827199.1 VOC family protein [Bowmanella dokdonensis]